MDGETQLEAQAAGAEETQQKTFGAEYVEELRAENAKRRIENRRLKERLERLEASMTEQKQQQPSAEAAVPASDIQRALEDMETRVQMLEAEIKRRDAAIQRLAVADEIGLPRQLAERLQGDTPEALRQDAEALLAVLQQFATPARSQTTPVPGGQVPTEGFDQIFRRLVYGAPPQSTSAPTPQPGPSGPSVYAFGGNE